MLHLASRTPAAWADRVAGQMSEILLGKDLVMQGLEDMIVVSTNDALLICRKQDEQKIRTFVNDLKSDSGDRYI